MNENKTMTNENKIPEIAKIKRTADETTVSYARENDEITVSSAEPPRPELDMAMQTVSAALTNLGGINLAARQVALIAEEIVIKWKADNIQGVVVKGHILAKDFPVNLDFKSAAIVRCTDPEFDKAIDALLQEAALFADGKRSQGTLFDQDGQPEENGTEMIGSEKTKILEAAKSNDEEDTEFARAAKNWGAVPSKHRFA